MIMDKLKNVDRDEVLAMLGLEVRRQPSDYLVPALTVFGAGLLVGAAVGLLFAPRPGRELREDISRRLHEAPAAFAKASQKAVEAGQRAGEAIREGANRTAAAIQAS
jgi:hypothetical protein